jgi:hypothetical protein
MSTKSAVVSIMLGVASMMFSVTTGIAQEPKFEMKASTTMQEVLSERVGKRTILRLRSGEDIDGTVVMVGNSLVHISKLAGKDFYDAVVDISAIGAVLFQARGPVRN